MKTELQAHAAQMDRVEAQALRLAEKGLTVRQISDKLDIGEPHITALLARLKPCGKDGCGEPSTAGRPRRGWVIVHRGQAGFRFCGWTCLARWIAGRRP